MSVAHRWIGIGIALCLGAIANASSVSNEVGLGSQQATATQPKTGFASDQLTGVFDISNSVSARLNVGLNLDQGQSPQNGSAFPQSTSTAVITSDFAIDWAASDHWDVNGDFNFSPATTSYQDTTVTFAQADGGTVPLDSLIKANNGSVGAGFVVDFNTAGDSAAETDVSVGVGWTRFSTLQQVAEAQGPQGNVFTGAQLQQYCQRATTAGARIACAELAPAFKADGAAFDQFRISGGIVETLFSDTDVGLSGAYYLYDADPTGVGTFSNSLRLKSRTVTASLGAGVPIAPLVYTVRPDLTHRFGPFSAGVNYQHGLYYGTQGYSNSVGVRLQYRFSRSWKIWLTATVQADTQPADSTANPPITTTTTSTQSSIAAGVRFSWK